MVEAVRPKREWNLKKSQVQTIKSNKGTENTHLQLLLELVQPHPQLGICIRHGIDLAGRRKGLGVAKTLLAASSSSSSSASSASSPASSSSFSSSASACASAVLCFPLAQLRSSHQSQKGSG
jgi:hypothetical protein